jgi:hypothetical protein
MAVDLDGIALDLVHDVNLLVVAKEHLQHRTVSDRGRRLGREPRTIMPLTRVLPTCSNEPADCASAAEAPAKARKERERTIVVDIGD